MTAFLDEVEVAAKSKKHLFVSFLYLATVLLHVLYSCLSYLDLYVYYFHTVQYAFPLSSISTFDILVPWYWSTIIFVRCSRIRDERNMVSYYLVLVLVLL